MSCNLRVSSPPYSRIEPTNGCLAAVNDCCIFGVESSNLPAGRVLRNHSRKFIEGVSIILENRLAWLYQLRAYLRRYHWAICRWVIYSWAKLPERCTVDCGCRRWIWSQRLCTSPLLMLYLYVCKNGWCCSRCRLENFIDDKLLASILLSLVPLHPMFLLWFPSYRWWADYMY